MSSVAPVFAWALAYLLVGAGIKAVTYLLTGIAQFPVDWDARSAETLVFDVLGFLIFRSGIALPMGVVITRLQRSNIGTDVLVAVVVLFPVASEIILLRDLVTQWPRLGMDGLLVGVAYLTTPLLTGSLLATAAVRVGQRKKAGGSA